jgi:hypothetical protein
MMGLAALGIALSWTAAASAQEEADAEEVWNRPITLSGQFGFGTPTGYYGVTLDYSPIPLLVATAGIGQGSGPYCKANDEAPASYRSTCSHWYRDLQYAAGGRVRVIRIENYAAEFGAGVSTGGYTWVEFTTDEPAYKSTERAWWGNVEISLEHRASWGFTTRGFIGTGAMLNPSSLGCVSWGAGNGSYSHCVADHAGDGHRLLYMGFDVGMAF